MQFGAFEFIPSGRAGVLQQAVEVMNGAVLKRRRVADFNGVVRALKGLKLFPSEATVHFLAWGSKPDGETGLFIGYTMPERKIAQVPNDLGGVHG